MQFVAQQHGASIGVAVLSACLKSLPKHPFALMVCEDVMWIWDGAAGMRNCKCNAQCKLICGLHKCDVPIMSFVMPIIMIIVLPIMHMVMPTIMPIDMPIMPIVVPVIMPIVMPIVMPTITLMVMPTAIFCLFLCV